MRVTLKEIQAKQIELEEAKKNLEENLYSYTLQLSAIRSMMTKWEGLK